MAPSRAYDARAVLVTRPDGPASQRLCALLRAAGFTAYSQPLIELHGLTSPGPGQRRILQELDRYQHVIFISGNAVQFGMELVESTWVQPPVGLRWYAVGAATAASLQEHGIHAITPGSAMSSEGLLALGTLQSIAGERVLLVKGEGGRDTLRQELTRRGATVDELACYRRCIPALAAGELAARLADWAIEAILVSSGEGLHNFQLLLSPGESSKLKAVAMIVPSSRVAAMARDAGFSQILTAANASDAAMLDALQKWRRGSGE